jgi:hypothetical protein
VLAADGLLSDDQAIQPHTWTMADATVVTQKIADQLAELNVKKIVVYTDKTDDNSAVLIPLGCVQIAAGSIGDITVEHHAGEV